MEPWNIDRVTLREGPARRQLAESPAGAIPIVDYGGESQLFEYKETAVTEYDGVQVYLQEGSYEHNQKIHKWSFYEYRMWINNECWNIIMNVDLENPPDWTYAGSNSAKLSHDFCHLNTDSSDEVYTNFSFVEMGGRTIWPFYAGDDYQEDLWIWVSPRRFAIITNHKHNEKLNHFYVDRMHEHNVLANRTICWRITEHVNHAGKVIDKQIALSRDTRCATADHENFLTGCEHKPAIKWRTRSDQQYGKRKFSDSPGSSRVLQVDQIGTYSANDLQKLHAVFAVHASVKPSTAECSQTANTPGLWRHGEVPSLGLATDGRARVAKQLEYARTLLAVTAKATAQMEEVVRNLEQMETELQDSKESDQETVENDSPVEPQTGDTEGDPPAWAAGHP